MIFGPIPTAEAEGAILAHSLQLETGRMRKGTRLGPNEIAALLAAGHGTVSVARLEPHDIGEDEAAARIAKALVPDPSEALLRVSRAATGRVNIHAEMPGLLGLDRAAIEAANRVDPGITIATLPPLGRMEARAMAATVKIIPYGVARAALHRVEELVQGAMVLRPVIMQSATLIQTHIGGDESLLPKGEAAVRARLEALGITMIESSAVDHAIEPLAEAIAGAQGEMVLILTASATSDAYDTAPEALRAAGGKVTRFGMPVDPGNLLFAGVLGAAPVIGLPGCARSPALNGADWVLERVACGVNVTDADIAAMGVGGLLKEVPARGHPRAGLALP